MFIYLSCTSDTINIFINISANITDRKNLFNISHSTRVPILFNYTRFDTIYNNITDHISLIKTVINVNETKLFYSIVARDVNTS